MTAAPLLQHDAEGCATLAMPRWPHHAADEIEAVGEVLRSGRTNQWTGTRVKAFEDAFATMHGRHAVALANGTVALEVALRALGVGPGDDVVVSSASFVASASCVSVVGATPVFADVDPVTQLVTPETIEACLSSRTRAVIPVHLNGRPCDMPAITALARRRDLVVIEDCAQAVGARIDGRLAGTFGEAAAFSFCQDKIITTGGEGGMVLLAGEQERRRAWSYKDHGKDPDLVRAGAPGGGYRWPHRTIGTNLRMTEMQAALGLAQLAKLDGWLAERARIAARLGAALERAPFLTVPAVPASIKHAFYRLVALVDPDALAPDWCRDRIVRALQAAGVGVLSGTCPEIYREGAFAGTAEHDRLPNARRLGETTLTFLVHPTMDEAYLTGCEAVLDLVLSSACRQ